MGQALPGMCQRTPDGITCCALPELWGPTMYAESSSPRCTSQEVEAPERPQPRCSSFPPSLNWCRAPVPVGIDNKRAATMSAGSGDRVKPPSADTPAHSSVPGLPPGNVMEEHEQEVTEDIVDAADAVHTCDAWDKLLDMTHPNYREVVCADGAYRGQVRPDAGAFEGYGCLKSSDATAVGYWQDGRLHGEGSQSWTDGRMYTGQFRDGTFSGHGRMQWQHPRGVMVYEGQYCKDKKHGNGRFTWPSGKAYEGQWVCGQRHGTGVDINPGGSRCQGIWEDNVFVRPLLPTEGKQAEASAMYDVLAVPVQGP
mmetsp:Transcript_93301/g.273128  ORF Transcript_93301/g.273128 Transcript_93301/m.273128 type:complete len:311 (+) Transcript_93301:67-999(+)